MNLYLIGYRGAGKSAVAQSLALRFNRECFCIDQRIQSEQELTIAEIFQQSGESRFRQLESEQINQAAAASNLIVDLGGGAVLDSANRQRIRQSGRCVWLRATPSELWRRIQSDQESALTRPALTERSGLEEIEKVLAQREPIYAECADFEIVTDELSSEQVARKIAEWFANVDKHQQ